MDSYKLRFIPIGGVVDITKNMYVYELYKNDELQDIIILDCGIGFPKQHELGIDFVIPDITYLLDKKDKIRAIILSHGHEDHISALRYHYEKLGRPPVYSAKLTALLVEAKCEEYGIKLRVNQIQYRTDYKLGGFTARFIHMTHSIPDTTHVLLKTPVGNFYHGSDFKLDLTPPFSPPPDFYEIAAAGEAGITCLFSDCLGTERPGLTLSESVVGQTFEDEMRSAKGKFIMTTFSSNISRIRQCVEAAIKFNRVICFLGRSMIQNTKLTKEIGYLPIPHSFLIDDKRVKNMPANKVCIIAAGSQGQFDSALSKIANNLNKFIKIEPGDKVVFSSDPIPGQEDDVYDLIERLYMLKAQVVYSHTTERLHASGHGNQDDLKFLIRFTKPKFLIPIGGTIRHQRQYLELLKTLSYKDNQVFLLQEGQTVLFSDGKAKLAEPIETRSVYVDAYGVGDVGNIVLRDRKTLSTEGIVVVVLVFDIHFKLIKSPEFVSRGFVFEKHGDDIFEKAKQRIETIISPRSGATLSESLIKGEVIHQLEQLFFENTGRRPLIAVELLNG